jgi:hypothetical protein
MESIENWYIKENQSLFRVIKRDSIIRPSENNNLLRESLSNKI